MSVYTNPADAAKEAANAYVTAVLKLIEDKDPITTLSNQVAELKELIQNADPTILGLAESAGKWSVAQVLQHLADSELVWAYRLRMVIAEESPVLTGYDQDNWARELHYENADAFEALEQIAVLRRINLRLINSLSPDELKRVGRHNERGDESVEHMIRLYAGHDLVHRNQIRRILANVV